MGNIYFSPIPPRFAFNEFPILPRTPVRHDGQRWVRETVVEGALWAAVEKKLLIAERCAPPVAAVHWSSGVYPDLAERGVAGVILLNEISMKWGKKGPTS